MAELLRFGDHPPTAGGDFERDCVAELLRALPTDWFLATNLALHRGGTEYYEVDAIVTSVGYCAVLEFKLIGVAGGIDVYEDAICAPGFRDFERALSLLDGKAKRLRSRLNRDPFRLMTSPRVGSFVVVPRGTEIRYHEQFTTPKPVLRIDDLIAFLGTVASVRPEQTPQEARVRFRKSWLAFRAGGDVGKASHRLGRFTIQRRLSSDCGRREYLAVDEPPSSADVRLTEYQFDPALKESELRDVLEHVSREMRVVRRIRHPNVLAVVGHFQTGASWVQVSDWFDSESLESRWSQFMDLPLLDRVGVFLSAATGLQHCHGLGVFHRHVSASSIFVAADWQDVRVSRFEYARDLEIGSTIPSTRLRDRDPRLISPEEILKATVNPRMTDVFQAGVLLYRLASGRWPFKSVMDYLTSGLAPPPATHERASQIVTLAVRMLDKNPILRPATLSVVTSELNRMASTNFEHSR